MDRRRSLQPMLRSFEPQDAADEAHRRRMEALLAIPGDPFSRRHFTPGHFTASAFVLSPERDALLMIHHERLDKWLQPGGHIDPQDVDVEAAARRELAEEAGMFDVERLGVAGRLFHVDIHAIPPRADEEPHAHFDLRFAFVARTRVLHAGSDARAARWVPLEAIAGQRTDASVLRSVARLRALPRPGDQGQ